MTPDERDLADSLLQQLVVTVGYGAGDAAMRVAAASDVGGVGGRVPIWPICAVGLAAFGGSALQRNRGLQTGLYMIVSRVVTGAVPVADEPAGFVVVPSVILYLACLAAGVCLGMRLAKPHGPYAQVFACGVTQFVVAFSTTRCQAAFERAGRVRMMQYLCCAYIVGFPESKLQGVASTWGEHMVRLMDSLACQGLILTLNAPLAGGGGGLQSAASYCALLLAAHLLRLGDVVPRARFCSATFCFAIAQGVLAAGLGGGATVLCFAAATACSAYVRNEGAGAALRTTSVAGVCMGAGDTLTGWLRGCGTSAEQLLAYVALCLLLQRGLDCLEATAAAPATAPADDAVMQRKEAAVGHAHWLSRASEMDRQTLLATSLAEPTEWE